MEAACKAVPKKYLLIIQGDWNANIVPDAFTQWAGTVARYRYGYTNERGWLLLEFANNHKRTLANTLYPHKESRRITWHSPDGKTHNQIDYFLVPKRFKSSINRAQTRVFPGADIGSDHEMVLLNLRLRLQKVRKPKSCRLRFNLDKLKDPEVASIFQAEVGGKFAALSPLVEDSLTHRRGQQHTYQHCF